MSEETETPKSADVAGRLDGLVGRAEALLDLIESDFGQSSRSVRVEAVVCELQNARSMALWEVVARAAKELGATGGTDAQRTR
ncbi:MAG: hypothetical protein ACYC1K_03525 [Minisyncoccota bacterium]